MVYRIGLILLSSLASVVAQTSAAFQFLRTTVSPRSAALGSATVALPADAGTVILNPAIGATVERQTLSSTFLKHVLDINAGMLLYSGLPIFSGRLTIGAVYMDYGVFDRRDANGQPLGQFSAHDVALAAWYSDTLEPRLFYGIGPKLVWERLDQQHAWALAFDAGLLYTFPDQRTSAALSLLHVGTPLHHSPQPSLPTDLRIGLTHFLQGLPAIFNLSFVHLTEPTPSVWQKFANFVVGIEFRLSSVLQLRLGYDNLLGCAIRTSSTAVGGGR